MNTPVRTLRLIVVFLLLSVAFGFLASRPDPSGPFFLGVTFSTVFARQLGLDPSVVFEAMLDDLKVRQVRLPLYWPDIEQPRGKFAWEETDRLFAAAAARGARVTLAIGRKVPRYPECFIPDWVSTLSAAEQERALMEYLEAAILRYKTHPEIIAWQVENEPFFPFGVCPRASRKAFEKELALVRSLDDRPILITMSGELEPWGWAARQTGALGISIYRITWNDLIGYFVYPLPPGFYRLRSWLVSRYAQVTVSELQAEPWFPGPISSRPFSAWEKAFGEKELRESVAFARRTGLSGAYLWGVEWWYLLRENGHPGLWETARELFHSGVL